MGTAVSDTSVLNYLARLGRSALLRDQFGHVIVPEAVLTELDNRPDLPGAGCVRQAVVEGWMEIAAPQNVAMVTLLRKDLGSGESQAIVLVIEQAAACVLIDEAEGRQRAAALGIPVVGTVGGSGNARQASFSAWYTTCPLAVTLTSRDRLNGQRVMYPTSRSIPARSPAGRKPTGPR